MKTKTIKVDYSIIEKGKKMPIAYKENGTIKTIFRTIKQNDEGFIVSINSEIQLIVKSEKAYKGVTTIVSKGKNAIDKVSRQQKRNEERKAKKAEKQAVKREKAPKKEVEIIDTFLPKMEVFAIEKDFLTENEVKTIQTVIDNVINGNKQYKSNGWKFNIGEKLEYYSFQFDEARNIIEKATTKAEIQIAMVMLLQDFVKNVAKKMLNLGAGYKKKENRTQEELEQALSYQNASSNNGKIRDFEDKDVYSELLTVSFEYAIENKLFSNEIFDHQNNVFTSLYFRTSNVLRTEIRRTASKASLGYDSDGNDLLIVEIDRQKAFTPEYFTDLVELAKQTTNLNDKECEILKMQLQGYTKKEIDEQTKKRNDRTYQSIKNKLEKRAGMTIKEVKEMAKKEKEELKKKRMEMKERHAEMIAKKASGETVPTFTNNILDTNKTLKAENSIMIDEVERMKKFK